MSQLANRQLGVVAMQAQMETMAKEKGDMFDTMVVDEAKIRLGEDGWKERYYQVSYLLSCLRMTVSRQKAVLHG